MRAVKPAFLRTVGRAAKGAYIHSRFSAKGMAKARIRHRVGFATIYNIFLQAHGKKPTRETYNLLQAFKNYVMVSDPIIDNVSFEPRKSGRFSMNELKEIPDIRKDITDFLRLLKKSSFSERQKRRIVKAFADFRRRAIKGIEMTLQDPFADKEQTFGGIEETAGIFLGTASDIAGICHGISEENMPVSRKAFENFTNALQIKDDMRDAAKDFGVVQNSIVSIARQHPEEFSKLERLAKSKRKTLSTKWVYKNLPKTIAEADKWFEKYYARIPDTKMTKKIRAACRDAYYGL